MSIATKDVSENERVKNVLRANYHKTALGKNSGISRPTRLFLKWLERHQDSLISNVLDLGAGKGRDTAICKERFNSYIGYDPHKDFGYSQPKHVIEQNYDLVICSYVLNVIIPEDRRIVIENLISHLQKGSMVVVGVRQDKYEIKENWKQFEDGYITSRLTFQHFFTHQEIANLFIKFAHINKLDSKGCYLLIPKDRISK